ncbi:SMI1/KNR4 family protein [Streptomyces sp. NPDC060065]|uniref:SMI1/KNR4 family protein n=1 Tax=Streptomyces sp. NPDC060065 TaxID=3347050 RepID=UPI00368129C5
MPRNFTDSVTEMLGSARNVPAAAGAWDALERDLGFRLPADYKKIIDCYAPVQLNGHLFLNHPATSRWNLGAWMRRTVENFAGSDLADAECPGFPEGPLFGGSAGLIPLVGSDRGEYVFGVAGGTVEEWQILACDGDEQDFHEYRMAFSEWLYRYLAGEDMFGPGSAVFYPGPVVFESMPMTESERSRTWHGPERGM